MGDEEAAHNFSILSSCQFYIYGMDHKSNPILLHIFSPLEFIHIQLFCYLSLSSDFLRSVQSFKFFAG